MANPVQEKSSWTYGLTLGIFAALSALLFLEAAPGTRASPMSLNLLAALGCGLAFFVGYSPEVLGAHVVISEGSFRRGSLEFDLRTTRVVPVGSKRNLPGTLSGLVVIPTGAPPLFVPLKLPARRALPLLNALGVGRGLSSPTTEPMLVHRTPAARPPRFVYWGATLIGLSVFIPFWFELASMLTPSQTFVTSLVGLEISLAAMLRWRQGDWGRNAIRLVMKAGSATGAGIPP